MEEKPLHVKVAEALGWKPFPEQPQLTGLRGRAAIWSGLDPATGIGDWIPRYDTDWSATGPLIEKYGITLQHGLSSNGDQWVAGMLTRDGRLMKINSRPLEAVCNLIIALRAAQK